MKMKTNLNKKLKEWWKVFSELYNPKEKK